MMVVTSGALAERVKKLKEHFEKHEIWFAVGWIILYVVGFSNADALSASIGVPKLLTVMLGFAMTAVLYGFIRKNKLSAYFGLCGMKVRGKDLLYFLPLIVISSVNLWNGIALNCPVWEAVLYIISMCFVAFLEEIIFRGLLFKGMCKENITSAIIVSSLTFGVGHVVNLLLGAPLLDTALQLVYASAVGFCYTVVFYVSGSILPCILSHAVVNSLSIFAVEPTAQMQVAIALVQTALGLGYGLVLLKKKKHQKIEENS